MESPRDGPRAGAGLGVGAGAGGGQVRLASPGASTPPLHSTPKARARLTIRSDNEPFQQGKSRMLVAVEPSGPATPARGLVKSLLVAPDKPPPPVVRALHANHPQKGKRRHTFSRKSKVLKQGLLMKMKVMDRVHEGEKAWHKRHCQIRDGFFLWFAPKHRKKPTGWVRVRDVKAVRMCDMAMALPGVDTESVTRSFQVVTAQRTLYFRARTSEDMQEWMRMLVSSKCLTPAPTKKKSFAFPEISSSPSGTSGTDVRVGLLPRLNNANSGEPQTDGHSEKKLRRKHSRAKHHKHHKHHHKHRKHSRSRAGSRSTSRAGSRSPAAAPRSRSHSKTELRVEGEAEAKAKAEAGAEAKAEARTDGLDAAPTEPTVGAATASAPAPTQASEGKQEVGGKTEEAQDQPTANLAVDTTAAAAAATAGGATGGEGKVVEASAKSTTSIDDWQAHWDEENKCTVYVNKKTQETTTKLPNFRDVGGAEGKWVKCFDYDAKKEYYFHTQTGETQYDVPEGFDEEEAEEQPGWGWGGWEGDLKSPAAKHVRDRDGPANDDVSYTPAAESKPDVEHWVECWDDTYHCPYYVNMESNVSVWERPTGSHIRITQYAEDDAEAEGLVEEDVVEVTEVNTVRSDALGVTPGRPQFGTVASVSDDDAIEEVDEELDADWS